jgi:GTP-binding protein
MFVDRIKVYAHAGDGGRGAASFRREKFVPRGGPDGGDGGRGGHVILQADIHTDNLANLFYEPIIKAKSGEAGMGRQKHGKNALDKVVKVPIGTVVYRAESPAPRIDEYAEPAPAAPEPAPAPVESQRPADPAGEVGPDVPDRTAGDAPSLEVIADLKKDGERFVLCAGGKGGKGNVHFKSATNRAPTQYTEGVPGEFGHFLLELRTIADAALVGYPNAGKSTLLSKVSAAHPKIAPYPFTTLRPSVGVVELDDYRRATVADIPGLIEGAHRNVGLGHDFLRHITRCRCLLFVVDIAGSEARHPIEDLQSLRREIDLYDPRLSKRPWCIIANKIDLSDYDDNLRAIEQRFTGVPVIRVSAERGEGIEEIKNQLRKWLPELVEPSTSYAEKVVANAEFNQ